MQNPDTLTHALKKRKKNKRTTTLFQTQHLMKLTEKTWNLSFYKWVWPYFCHSSTEDVFEN